MQKTTQNTGTKRHSKPVIGSRVAKELLYCLREMREWEADSIHKAKYRETEEIEAWEDLIRDHVREWRKAPREVLDLDSETSAALDDITCRRGRATDARLHYRREFALRAIKAVCSAWLDRDRELPLEDWAVTIREKTEDEREIDRLMLAAAIPPIEERGKP